MRLFKLFIIFFLVVGLMSCGTYKKFSILDSVEIPSADIENVVENEMKRIKRTYLIIDKTKYSSLLADFEDGNVLILFKDGIVYLGFDIHKKKPNGNVKIVMGLYKQPFGDIKIEEKFVYKASGIKVNQKRGRFLLKSKVHDVKNQKPHFFEIAINESLIGGGTTEVKIENKKAIITGVLGTQSFVQIKDLIDNHREVDTLVFQYIPGSMNDAVNMHTGRLIKKMGYKIIVPADGMIASGGVDLFCAGKEKIVELGAKVGIHSWCCHEDKAASELPQDHPAHEAQINYFTDVMGKRGKAFYFHTLKAAPFDGIHWMNRDELIEWNLISQ